MRTNADKYLHFSIKIEMVYLTIMSSVVYLKKEDEALILSREVKKSVNLLKNTSWLETLQNIGQWLIKLSRSGSLPQESLKVAQYWEVTLHFEITLVN